MSKATIAFLMFSLIASGILLPLSAPQANSNSTPTPAKKYGPTPTTHQAVQFTETSENFLDEGEKRVDEIGLIVSKSIEIDKKNINYIDAKIVSLARNINSIKKSIADLGDNKHYLNNRLQKLSTIYKVLVGKDNTQTERPAAKRRSSKFERKKRAIFKGLSKKVKESIVDIDFVDGTIKVLFDAKTLLILDHKPVRVGISESKHFVSFVNSFSKKHHISSVRLKVREGTPLRQMITLSKYLKKQFKWDSQLVMSDNMKIPAVAIELIAKENFAISNVKKRLISKRGR